MREEGVLPINDLSVLTLSGWSFIASIMSTKMT